MEDDNGLKKNMITSNWEFVNMYLNLPNRRELVNFDI